MGKFIDLTGAVYGRLTVVRYDHTNRHCASMWLCRCECGQTKVVNMNNLRTGHVLSCGCWQAERRIETHTIHGESKSNTARTPEWQAWRNMRQRCLDPGFKDYHNYGGGGITFCERWATYTNFLEDMGRMPAAGYTLERIDNNRGYCKENCRWATMSDQGKNTRRIRYLTHDGKTLSLAEWSRATGIKRSTITQRIDACGWPVSKALTHK